MERLKAETRPQHDKAEQGGFGTRVMGGGLTRDMYAAHLVTWNRILSHLEEALRNCEDPIVAAVWHEGLAKEGVLATDIDALSAADTPLNGSTEAGIERFCAMIDDLAASDPPALLGPLYVLEGSTLGGTIMKPRIASQLGLKDGPGLTYYGVYGKEVGRRFGEFRGRMSGAADDSGHEDAIVESAKATFDHVGLLLVAIVASANAGASAG